MNPFPKTFSERSGWRAWIQTTGGVVAAILLIQFITGVLLAFYYVPSIDHAHVTVTFIEKVLAGGSWIRSLHHYGSLWLPLFLFVHLVRLYVEETYSHCPGHWIAAVLLLGLSMAGGATGYSLPWDARAFFSTRVAEGLLGGLPLVGKNARLWLLGGNEISAITLSRFFALHVLVTPFLILVVVSWRGYGMNVVRRWSNLNRHLLAGGLAFAALALYAAKFPAPLGPPVSNSPANYLPRPGAQFLWVYQSLKYMPGALGSIVGVVLPALVLFILIFLPWLDRPSLRKFSRHPPRMIGGLILASCSLLVVSLTTLCYLSDKRDPRTRIQLARQATDEAAFRQAPFVPQLIALGADTSASAQAGPPEAYTKLCATCHGNHGEGARQGNLRFPPLIGVASKPRRSVDDIVGLLNDPTAYGLEPPMKSFATKLTDQEKRTIAEWVVKLK
jgi:ubiquinol-cytochrome c reductase cytochrome b subunit